MTKKLTDTSRSSKKLRKLTKSPNKLQSLSKLPDLGSLLSRTESPEYLELAHLLDELLCDEFNRSEQPTDTPFYGTEAPDHSNLLKLPTLITLLADLPVRNAPYGRQELIPLVRAILPDGFNIQAILAGESRDTDLEMVDALYHQAVVNDSKAAMNLADRVLFRLAVTKSNSQLLPRLVSRFYEFYRPDDADRHSLRECVVEHAHARLKIMQLAVGTPSEIVLRAPFKNTNSYGVTLVEELLDLATEGGETFFKKLHVWMEAKKKVVTNFWPDLVPHWKEQAAAKRVTFKFTLRRNPQVFELIETLDELRHLHGHFIGAVVVADAGTSANSDHEKSGMDSVRNSTLLRMADPIFSNVDDDEEESNENSETDEKQPNKNDPSQSLVVFPKMNRTGNRDLDERLKFFSEELSEQPLPLLQTPDLRFARSKLITMLPHLTDVVDRILNAMAPHSSIKIPPVLLVGQPGCGKTTLAEELASALLLPSITFDAGGVSDANFLGVDMRWSTGAQGLHLDLITEHKIANPLIIIDEIEKMGGSSRNGDARKKLMGLLEPRSAAAFYDPFLNKPINLSRLNWLFTANTVEGIPAPLQNRLEIIRCPLPKREHVEQLAPQLLKAEYQDRGFSKEWCQPLSQDELQALRRHWAGGSIRYLKRLIRAVIDAREKFMAQA